MFRVLKWLLWGVILIVAVSVVINIWVVKSTEADVYESVAAVPKNKVALVLGTSHRTVKGNPNPFFTGRIKTAADLYKQNKVSHFILSGDNRTRYYNEPQAMKNALMKEGVPDTCITLDYAGLRTLDSIVRSKEIFGQDKITIITQPFHCYRALFISNYYGMDAVAMVAGEPDFDETPGVRIREFFARGKAVLDLYVLKTEPRYLGQKEGLSSEN